jgi:hypothetical protein
VELDGSTLLNMILTKYLIGTLFRFCITFDPVQRQTNILIPKSEYYWTLEHVAMEEMETFFTIYWNLDETKLVYFFWVWTLN